MNLESYFFLKQLLYDFILFKIDMNVSRAVKKCYYLLFEPVLYVNVHVRSRQQQRFNVGSSINQYFVISKPLNAYTHHVLLLLVQQLSILASFKENNERRKKRSYGKCVRLWNLLDYAHKTTRKHALTFNRLLPK